MNIYKHFYYHFFLNLKSKLQILTVPSLDPVAIASCRYETEYIESSC